METVLKSYQDQIEEAIRQNILTFGEKTELYSACEYALLNGGKRFRPAIALMVAKALGKSADVLQAALAVEYFHTASLIADDLPCMDNDDKRRGKASTHKVYGEATALLASYSLIAAGYGLIADNSQKIAESDLPFSANAGAIAILAIQNASYNTGILGASGGQYLDLFVQDRVREAIEKKTASLFEISFVFGYLFGGGDITKIDQIKQSSAYFGRAFQIADDIDDMSQDLKNGSKANAAIIHGKEKALELLQDELFSFFQSIEVLGLNPKEFKELAKSLILIE
ncbi:MAG TPA: polyprenyl synthetase family protein [Parachlamydiaceae bacterium]|nr:polyprenyl synthetase family protein [Parachlamydiaceae bacterium]